MAVEIKTALLLSFIPNAVFSCILFVRGYSGGLEIYREGAHDHLDEQLPNFSNLR